MGENPGGCPPPGDIRHADVRICRTRAGAGEFVTLRYDKRGPAQPQHKRGSAQPQPLPEPGDDRGVRHRRAARGLLTAALGRAERGDRARPQRRLPGSRRDRQPDPSPARGHHRRPGPGRHRGRHRCRAAERRSPAGAGRGLGTHRGVRVSVPRLALGPPPADLPVRRRVHGRRHPEGARLRIPLAVPRLPSRLPALHRGVGRRVPGRGGGQGHHRRDDLDQHCADCLQGDALRGRRRHHRVDDRARPPGPPGRRAARRRSPGRGRPRLRPPGTRPNPPPAKSAPPPPSGSRRARAHR